MSERLVPILDWLATHTPGWKDPPALHPRAYAHLPTPLRTLFEARGHAPGAFPRACVRERWLRDPADITETPQGWTISELGRDGGWFCTGDGVLWRQQADHEHSGLVEVGTVDDVLEAHLARLVAGELVFAPLLGTYLYPDERPDLGWASAEVAPGSPYVIERITRELRAGREVRLGGLGSFRVQRSRAVEAFGARQRPRVVPAFEASDALKSWLGGDPIDAGERDPLLAALVEGLLEHEICGWPGLGRFAVRRPRARGGVRGVPEVRVEFRPWERLVLALG